MKMVNVKETHLTPRQFEILKMRVEGKTLAEIAEELHTSRSNVSHITKIAERNVERAKNTLRLIGTLEWPVRIEVQAGSNIYKVCERVFQEADERGIKIPRNYSELVRLITETLGKKNLRRRKALTKFSVVVSKDGGVEVL